jgi:tRNA(Ile)-lysidine synthase
MAESLTPLASKALATSRQHGLLGPGDRVVAAVSGGPDSMALLDVLVELRAELDLWLCVAHLNHGLRASAAADADFVAGHAAELGLPVRLGVRDVAAERRRFGGSLEMAARRARYAFLTEVAAEAGATTIATGHTADDQVETVLQRLLRGGELGALAGMPVARPLAPGAAVRVVRPLLDATRADVLAHLARRGLAYCVDETNADPAFQRNAVRHELLPLLEARCGSGLRARLLALAQEARELTGLVDALADGLVNKDEDGVRLAVARVERAPRLVRRAAVRRAFARAGGRGPLPRGALDAVEGLLVGGSGREVRLPDGLTACRVYGDVVLRPAAAERTGATAGRQLLAVPGRVEARDAGLWVEAEVLAGRPACLTAGGGWEEVVDLDEAGEPLVVRGRAAGDWFVPFGLGARKKLKDFLMDARVPRAERGRALVVEGPRGIVWIVGHRLDDRARVRPGSRRLARLRAGRIT